MKVFTPPFEIGTVITNKEMTATFKIAYMGGMRRSKTTGTLVIISDHTKGLYDDKWYGDELHYTGMGKNGDQVLDRNQNKTLAESSTNGVEVHLFEVLEASKYIYQGVVHLCGSPYQEEQEDEQGRRRKVWMFPLRTSEHAIAVTNSEFNTYTKRQEKKAKLLTKEELEKKARERSSKKVAYRSVTSTTYIRDPYVSEYAKKRAAGVCELCGCPAPFNDKDGNPYLESHHIEWLSKGGEDSIENTVALCPNCHRKMHVVNDPSDKEIILRKAK